MSVAFTVPAERANRAHYETHAVSLPARSFTGDDASTLVGRVLVATERHLAGVPRTDDTTVMVVRRTQ